MSGPAFVTCPRCREVMPEDEIHSCTPAPNGPDVMCAKWVAEGVLETDPRPGEVWRHVKGNLYRIIELGLWEPNPECEPLVVYTLAEPRRGPVWIRNIGVFRERFTRQTLEEQADPPCFACGFPKSQHTNACTQFRADSLDFGSSADAMLDFLERSLHNDGNFGLDFFIAHNGDAFAIRSYHFDTEGPTLRDAIRQAMSAGVRTP